MAKKWNVVAAVALALPLALAATACGGAPDPEPQGNDPASTPAEPVLHPEVVQCINPPPLPPEYGACTSYPSCLGLSNVSTTNYGECVNFSYEWSGGKCQWVSLGTYGTIYAYGAKSAGTFCDPCPCGKTQLL